MRKGDAAPADLLRKPGKQSPLQLHRNLSQFLGLAPKIMTQVMDMVVRLSRENGITIVLVEQNARAALAIADHGVVLNLGRVVAAADARVLAADVALRHHYLGF